MSARTLTRAAQAAKVIRTALRAQGLEVTVKSRNFSMGDSVDVHMTDQKPAVRRLVEQYCGKFQAGSFNSMEDIYEYSNKSSDLPQAKYVHVQNAISDAMREAIYQHLREAWHGGEGLPATFEEGRDARFGGGYAQEFVYRLFRDEDSTFWKSRGSANQWDN